MGWNTLTPNLMVEDVGETVAWYERVLDAETLARMPEGAAETDLVWAQVQVGDVDLMFQGRESLTEELPAMTGVDIGGSLTLYVDVDDVGSLHEELAGAASVVVDLRETDYGRREFAVADCNGYVLWFGERMAD